MSPQEQLNCLQEQKSILRARIAARRAEIAGATAVVIRPLVWIDRVRSLWRQVAPILQAAAPAFAARDRPSGLIGTLRRWAPAVTGLWRAVRARREAAAAPP